MKRRVVLALVALGIAAAFAASYFAHPDEGLLGKIGVKPRNWR